MSTPRTDAAAYEYTPERSEADEFHGRFPHPEEVVPADFARTLERELERLRAALVEIADRLVERSSSDAANDMDEIARNALKGE